MRMLPSPGPRVKRRMDGRVFVCEADVALAHMCLQRLPPCPSSDAVRAFLRAGEHRVDRRLLRMRVPCIVAKYKWYVYRNVHYIYDDLAWRPYSSAV